MSFEQTRGDDCPILDRGFFSKLDDDLLAVIRREMVHQEYQTGQVIFHEGTPAGHIYALHYGMAKLYKSGSNGKDLVFRLVGPGDPMGHVSVLSGETYATSAQAVQRMGACVLPRSVFLDTLARSPHETTRFLTLIARELLEREEQLAVQIQQTARQRAARLLLQLVRNAPQADGTVEILLPLKRSEMAEMIATTPETLSRIFRALQDDGVIRQSRFTIHVLDMDRLHRVAEERDRTPYGAKG